MRSTAERSDQGHGEVAAPSGLAHVAAVSFLASRAIPSVGFWVALAGGVSLARASQRRGARIGYGVSLAAMLQTVAIMGPARFGVPFTQAASAPLLGRMERNGTRALWQVLACAVIRLLHNAIAVAFFIVVITGGLDAYTAAYDSLAEWIPFLPKGTAGALVLTAAGLLGWTAFASIVQVAVYRRGLRLWSHSGTVDHRPVEPDPSPRAGRRFDPRAVALAAAIAFALLVASTAWALLAMVSVWLTVAWALSRADRDVVPAGLVLAAILAAGAFAFTAVGGLGLDLAGRRAGRALLLVLVATWLRAATGSLGLREVARRVLGRLGRVPSVREAVVVLDELGSGRQLVPAARSVLDALRPIRKRPLPVLDAVLGWVAVESSRFRAASPEAGPQLHARARDAALVTLAAAPIVVLIAG